MDLLTILDQCSKKNEQIDIKQTLNNIKILFKLFKIYFANEKLMKRIEQNFDNNSDKEDYLYFVKNIDYVSDKINNDDSLIPDDELKNKYKEVILYLNKKEEELNKKLNFY